MFQVTLSPKWILERLGLAEDPELVEMLSQLFARASMRPDKRAFVKECLRKALEVR